MARTTNQKEKKAAQALESLLDKALKSQTALTLSDDERKVAVRVIMENKTLAQDKKHHELAAAISAALLKDEKTKPVLNAAAKKIMGWRLGRIEFKDEVIHPLIERRLTPAIERIIKANDAAIAFALGAGRENPGHKPHRTEPWAEAAKRLSTIMGASVTVSENKTPNGFPYFEINLSNKDKAEQLVTKLATIRKAAGLQKYEMKLSNRDGVVCIDVGGRMVDETRSCPAIDEDMLKKLESQEKAFKEAVKGVAEQADKKVKEPKKPDKSPLPPKTEKEKPKSPGRNPPAKAKGLLDVLSDNKGMGILGLAGGVIGFLMGGHVGALVGLLLGGGVGAVTDGKKGVLGLAGPSKSPRATGMTPQLREAVTDYAQVRFMDFKTGEVDQQRANQFVNRYEKTVARRMKPEEQDRRAHEIMEKTIAIQIAIKEAAIHSQANDLKKAQKAVQDAVEVMKSVSFRQA